MEYNSARREIKLRRELSNLDKLVLKFCKLLEKHTEYVIVSGYVSIVLGRSRATEDVDLFIKKIPFEKFRMLYADLKNNGFWCLNAENPEEVYSFLENRMAVRFSLENKPIPNFEIKFPKREVDNETFEDFILVRLSSGEIKISSLERQIAFKRYYLKSEKDIEDAIHIEEIFKGKIDYSKINKLKNIIKDIKD